MTDQTTTATEDTAKTIDRLTKLMALALNNPNPNEASTARVRAEAIAHEHGIDLADLDGHTAAPFTYVADGSIIFPHNPVTGHHYSGGNIARLWDTSARGECAGFGQWKEAGRQVRAKETGTKILRFFWKVDKKTGEKKRAFARATVFGFEQTEAIALEIADAISTEAGTKKARAKKGKRKGKRSSKRTRVAA